ncbi:protein obstructor-E-like [Limulus polyphemus]|uniref:Protein obstructor-E-like n=1 Tax=Limulus polyphemus TaxID=6850 RepID=A0ABM1C482_LIMPO|nr:protein obstructor-E-like [Limulus polyphemus]
MKVWLNIFLLVGVAYAQQRTDSQGNKDYYDYYDYDDNKQPNPNPADPQSPRAPDTVQSPPRYQPPTSRPIQPAPVPVQPAQPARRVNRPRQRNRGPSIIQTSEVFNCPEPFGFFPHARNCDRYWACENGTSTLKLCGNGLVFDDTDGLRENCAYPFSVDCGDRTELEPPISTPNCPRLYGIFDDTSNCRVFYSCWNGDAARFECPPGLAYDHEQRVCVWADLVSRCNQLEIAEGFVCPDPADISNQPGIFTRHAHPTDCRKFYVCIEGTARPYGCQIGTVFKADTLQCDDPENVPGCENYYADLDIDTKTLAKLQG